jgi:hypothetical protein
LQSILISDSKLAVFEHALMQRTSMNIFSKRLANILTATLIFSLTLLPCARAQAESIADLQRGFEHPPDNARIMMRWWWFGPAVTKPELEREMRLMKEGGIGSFDRIS